MAAASEALETQMKVASAPRRILVREVNWLGDLTMSLPALAAIRQAFPAAHLAVLVRSALAGFFDAAPWVDEVITFSVGRGFEGIRDRFALVRRIRAGNFDLAVLFPRSLDSALSVALSGVPERVGVAAQGRGLLLSRRVRLRSNRSDSHQSTYWLELVRAGVGANGPTPEIRLDPPEGARHAMGKRLAAAGWQPGRTLIALAAAAAYGPAKEWPADHYAALVSLLADRFAADSVLVGTAAERQRCEGIAAASGRRAIVMAGQTTVGELIAMLSLCDGFAGNDSGPMHLAAALGIPTCAIFGSTNPVRTGPIGPRVRILSKALDCSPCLARRCRFGHYNCLREIAPHEVVQALQELGLRETKR